MCKWTSKVRALSLLFIKYFIKKISFLFGFFFQLALKLPSDTEEDKEM